MIDRMNLVRWFEINFQIFSATFSFYAIGNFIFSSFSKFKPNVSHDTLQLNSSMLYQFMCAQVWWGLHFLMVQEINQVYFYKTLQKLVVTGPQPGFCLGWEGAKPQDQIILVGSVADRVKAHLYTARKRRSRKKGHNKMN